MSNRRHRALVVGPAIVVGGITLGVWLWRRWGYPVRAEKRDVARAPAPPVTDVPEPPGHAPIQHEADGTGPRFHRRYQVDVAQSEKSPTELISRITRDIQHYVPDEIAVFKKTTGGEGALVVGDEYDITIRAPWDGPVRVVEVLPTRFTLSTLEGHMEAGQIRFEARDHPSEDGALRFSIESWARSADDAVDLAYDTLGVAKQGQQAMWTFFCERVAEDCGGHRMGEVEVLTEREARDD